MLYSPNSPGLILLSKGTEYANESTEPPPPPQVIWICKWKYVLNPSPPPPQPPLPLYSEVTPGRPLGESRYTLKWQLLSDQAYHKTLILYPPRSNSGPLYKMKIKQKIYQFWFVQVLYAVWRPYTLHTYLSVSMDVQLHLYNMMHNKHPNFSTNCVPSLKSIQMWLSNQFCNLLSLLLLILFPTCLANAIHVSHVTTKLTNPWNLSF